MNTINYNKRQSTDWCFTYNVQEQQDAIEALKQIKNFCEKSGEIVFLRVQAERGEEGGNLHLQGFLITKSRKRWSTLNRVLALSGAHWEPRKGTREQAAAYCSKMETRVGFFNYEDYPTEYTYGELPQRKRTARTSQKELYLEDVKEDIECNGTMPKLKEMPASIIFSGVVDRIGTYLGNTVSYTEMKDHMHTALVLHSKAGIGKSYTAVKIAEEIFGVEGVLKTTVNDRNRLWFPPMIVKPEARCCVIDEFHWGSIATDQFKSLLSGDAPFLETKGGHRLNLFEVVIITTNDDPHKWGAPYKKDGEGRWVPDDEDDEALNKNDNYKAIQHRIICLDCTQVGWLSEGQDTYAESWAFMETWLRDKLSWAATPAADLRRRIGEGAASQPLPDLEEEAEEPVVKTPRLGTWGEGEEGLSPIQRTDAVSHLASDNEEDKDEDRMQPED